MLTNYLHYGSRLAVILAPLTLAAFWGDPEEETPRAAEDSLERTAVAASVEPNASQPAVSESGELLEDVHAELFREYDEYPSARTCAQCHPAIYEEWRSSAHAYSGLSPMFHRFEQTLNFLANGTVDAFCVRCHLPVGTAKGQPREMSLPDRAADTERFVDPYVSIEGVTCVACHRVSAENYGRVNGERFIEPGTIFEDMYGLSNGGVLDQVKEDMARRKVGFSEEDVKNGKNEIMGHGGVKAHGTIDKSQFCMGCHQVAVHPGIKLEVVWDQFLASPAYDDGATCQDCHMGQDPGKWAKNDAKDYGVDRVKNYGATDKETGQLIPTPRATVQTTNYFYGPNGSVVNFAEDATIEDNLHRDHAFIGPGYSIAHPGIFPHVVAPPQMKRTANWKPTKGLPESRKEPTISEWLEFDWESNWGRVDEATGESLEDDFEIPAEIAERYAKDRALTIKDWVWYDPDNRKLARKTIEENEAALAARENGRRKVMENGSHLDGPFFASKPRVGKSLSLHYDVTNECEGHNFPSGSLGAQPQVWLNVALIGPDGENKWESGYVDFDGDIADLHSSYVQQGLEEHDDQLFNLQSKFLTTNIKGTDREMYLPVNIDVDQVPFIRPAGVPSTVLNHPPFIRMEQKSIPPLSTRKAKYKIPGSAFEQPGTYKLAVRLRSRAEPIYFMKFVGASPQMIERMNERMLDIHPYVVEFEVQ